MSGNDSLSFKHVLIVGSVIKYRRGLAEALLRHLNRPKFSVIDPQSRPLPEHLYDWSDIDLVFIDISKDKPSIRSWFFDYPAKDKIPPIIFIDNQATVDDAGDLVRAGAADYIDLRGLKRSRLTRALVIASAMESTRTMASPDGKYSDMQATQIIDVMQSLNADEGDVPSRSIAEDVVVLDDPEATGLLPVVTTDRLSMQDTQIIRSDESDSAPINKDDPVTEVLPQLNTPSVQKNIDRGNRDRAAMAAMGIVIEEAPTVSNDSDPQSSPQADASTTAVAEAEAKNSAEDPLLATGLMSILERNQMTDSEEKTTEADELKSVFSGQRWPFTHSDIEQGKASLGGYAVQEFIGVGGTASVFKVSRETDSQVFVMKLFDTDSPDNLGRDRFSRGYKLLQLIQHPNICSIEELVTGGEYTFVILEYLPGGDLRSRINAGIERDEAVIYMSQIGAALYGAHSQQIIHRDIKPSNILFRDDGSLALVDFGIAKQMAEIEQQVTKHGQVMGTPYYISPEQATGEKVDHRGDLYALGVIMYEMLEGKRPYNGNSSMEIMTAHVRDPIPHLSNKGDALNGIVSRLLSKQPDDRFPSGRDLVLALKSICPNGVSLETLKTVI